MKRNLNLLASSLLVLGSAPAFAQPANFIDTVRGTPGGTSGSDTLNMVMEDVINTLRSAGQLSASGGITKYIGCGSSCGERVMTGSPNSGDGAANSCTPNDADELPDNNSGCQEIAAMSRPLQSGICDDDPNNDGSVNTTAEGLVVALDGIVVLGNNNSIGAFGRDAAACTAFFAGTGESPNTDHTYPDRGVGLLRKSGTLAGGSYTITDWKDVLRLVYTGCKNTDGTCSAATGTPPVANTTRVARCGSDVRKDLVANWANLFEGVACAGSAGCPTGLRHAYRRDDASGTTGAFLELLGVAFSSEQLTSRTRIGSAFGGITPLPANLSYCDGGELEGIFPTHLGPATATFPTGEPLYTNSDPIRTTCAPEDDLCGPDGKLALVRAIRNAENTPGAGAFAYPEHQCQRKFAYLQYQNLALPICPDRTKPSAGRCRFPFFESGGFRTFNCMTSARQSSPAAPAGTDGRAYNFIMRDAAGVVQYQDGATARLPYVASFRQNMAILDNSALANGKKFTPHDVVCQEADTTRNIGCLTANSRCVLGFAGREGAFNTSQVRPHLNQEPAIINGITVSNTNVRSFAYPFSRNLYINASRGFENIVIDCKNRGGTQDYCQDQRRIATEFFNVGAPGNFVNTIVTNSGLIPLLGAAQCIGAAASATCGAPTSQPLAACSIDPSLWSAINNN